MDKTLYEWVLSFMAVEDPFSYDILMMAQRIEDKSMPTLGVCVKDHEIFLYYNPEFLARMDKNEIVFILRHEVLHIALHHCTVRNPSDPDEKVLANIAMDLAINSLINEVSGCKFPRFKEDEFIDAIELAEAPRGKHPKPKLRSELGKLKPNVMPLPSGVEIKDPNTKVFDVTMSDGSEHPFIQVGTKGEKIGEYPEKYNYPPRLAYEQYLEMLRKDKQEGGGGSGQGSGQGGGSPPPGGKSTPGGNPGKNPSAPGFDDHGGFDQSAIVDELVRNQIDITQKSNRWGTMTADVAEIVKKAQTTEIPWWTLLKHEVGKFISPLKITTIKRPHKKFGYPWFGTKSDCQDAVLVGWDTSGSVPSSCLGKFTAELERLNMYTPVFLMQFDCSLKQDKSTKFVRKRIRDMKILGRGGTCFQPLIDYAIDHKYRKVIIMTDGEAPMPDLKGKHLQVLWVITPDGSSAEPSSYPGRMIKMKKPAF